MNWIFWRKKSEEAQSKPEPRRFEIPESEVLAIRVLYDNYRSLPAKADRESHYLLWSAIAQIVPEVRTYAFWEINFPTALRVEIVECLDDPVDLYKTYTTLP